MRSYSIEEIHRCFSRSGDFNEILDAFQAALAMKLRDPENYRSLFWNRSLSSDEICFFGEKLAAELPEHSYDVVLWIASVFEVMHSSEDNYDLALRYYMRAAELKPDQPGPYLSACECYDPDLNIPPVQVLIEFVKRGLPHVADPGLLYNRLALLCELSGDPEQGAIYRGKAGEKKRGTEG